jgi:primary-amine oxidase
VAISLAVRKYVAEQGIKALRFATCKLLPPPKKDVLQFLGIQSITGERPMLLRNRIRLPRKADVDVSEQRTIITLPD